MYLEGDKYLQFDIVKKKKSLYYIQKYLQVHLTCDIKKKKKKQNGNYNCLAIFIVEQFVQSLFQKLKNNPQKT